MNFYKINFSSQHLGVQGILDSDWSVAVFCSHIFYSFEMYKTYIKYITKPYEISYTLKKMILQQCCLFKKKKNNLTLC